MVARRKPAAASRHQLSGSWCAEYVGHHEIAMIALLCWSSPYSVKARLRHIYQDATKEALGSKKPCRADALSLTHLPLCACEQIVVAESLNVESLWAAVRRTTVIS